MIQKLPDKAGMLVCTAIVLVVFSKDNLIDSLLPLGHLARTQIKWYAVARLSHAIIT